jgi:hypothetical protein
MYDTSGVEQWVTRYNGPADHDDMARAIALDNSGNVYVTGSSEAISTDLDYATVKYNASGVEQWATRYNNTYNGLDMAQAITLDDSGNVYVTGRSFSASLDSDYATLKYDSLGIQQWVARYNGPGSGNDVANAIALDNSNNIYVAGYSVGEGTDCDYATLKYSPLGVTENIHIAVKQYDVMTTIFRGPLQLPEDKKCRVLDITGRVVESDKIQPGIYFIEIDGVVKQKVVKVR